MNAPVPHPLTVVVSPYHLTTQEVPALCSLLLADQVVTLMPAPAAGTSRQDVAEAVERSPRYLRFMESWRWTMPLWEAGVVGSTYQGEEVAGEIAELYRRLSEEERLAPLQPLMRRQTGTTPEEMLDAVSADILKGGPDPGISIPIVAAIDAFAVRHGLPVARSAASSIAQRAEARLGQRLFMLPMPVLLRASGRRLLDLRRRLLPELGPLREQLRAAIQGAREGGVGGPRCDGVVPVLASAVRDLARAFDAAHSLIGGDDDEGRRVTHGFVSVAAAAVPEDVVLRSSLAAVRAVGQADVPASAVGGGEHTQGRLIVLVVKEMTVRPDVL